jgi:hypothetical protein
MDVILLSRNVFLISSVFVKCTPHENIYIQCYGLLLFRYVCKSRSSYEGVQKLKVQERYAEVCIVLLKWFTPCIS